MEPPHGDGWERDPDVLDTWFSSGALAVRDARLARPDAPELRAFYPTDVLSTARDILFLWVARMIMMGLEFVDEIPFDDVYVHSIIQAPDGRRMSKSLGTGIDPLDLIDGGAPAGFEGGDFPAYGADAVRFGLLAMSSTQDVRFTEDEDRAGPAAGQQAVERLAARAAERRRRSVAARPGPETVEDRWILSRLQRAKQPIAERIDEFDFSHAALGLYDFVYGELCDWYLEMVKPRLRRGRRRRCPATLAARPARDAGARAPGDPVRDRGDLVATARHRGPARRPRARSARPALLRRGRRGEVGRAIAAVQALRGWRDAARRAGGRASCRRGSRPTATTHGRAASRGWRGWSSAGRRRRRDRGHGRDPRRRRRVLRGRGASIRGRPPQARRASARQLESEIARAEGKLANEGFVAKAPRRSCRPSATSSSGCARAGGAVPAVDREPEAGPRGGPPALARAVRDALRPRPHAPADDRARLARRSAFAPIHVVGHQRQVLDRPDGRGAARRPTGCAPAPTCRRT